MRGPAVRVVLQAWEPHVEVVAAAGVGEAGEVDGGERSYDSEETHDIPDTLGEIF